MFPAFRGGRQFQHQTLPRVSRVILNEAWAQTFSLSSTCIMGSFFLKASTRWIMVKGSSLKSILEIDKTGDTFLWYFCALLIIHFQNQSRKLWQQRILRRQRMLPFVDGLLTTVIQEILFAQFRLRMLSTMWYTKNLANCTSSKKSFWYVSAYQAWLQRLASWSRRLDIFNVIFTSRWWQSHLLCFLESWQGYIQSWQNILGKKGAHSFWLANIGTLECQLNISKKTFISRLFRKAEINLDFMKTCLMDALGDEFNVCQNIESFGVESVPAITTLGESLNNLMFDSDGDIKNKSLKFDHEMNVFLQVWD